MIPSKLIRGITPSGLPEASSLVPRLVSFDVARGHFKGSFSELVIVRGMGALHAVNAPEMVQLLDEYALVSARQQRISVQAVAVVPLFGYFVMGFVSLVQTFPQSASAEDVADTLPFLKQEMGLFSREAGSLADRLIEIYDYPRKRSQVTAAVDALADAGSSLLREENSRLYGAVDRLTSLLASAGGTRIRAHRAAGLTYALLTRS